MVKVVIVNHFAYGANQEGGCFNLIVFYTSPENSIN